MSNEAAKHFGFSHEIFKRGNNKGNMKKRFCKPCEKDNAAESTYNALLTSSRRRHYK